MRLSEAVSREFAKAYHDRYGLTRPEWRVFATLGQYGTMTATAIGAHSAMHKTKVSRAVAALENRKWLARETDPADRRVELLSLTKAGRAAYRDMVPVAREFDVALLKELDGQQQSAVTDIMAAMETALLEKRRSILYVPTGQNNQLKR
jgi:DNA-binding MarR family transcriptional regulator